MFIEPQSLTREQFARPLDIIRLEHERQLLLYERLMEHVKGQEPETITLQAKPFLVFLTQDLVLHHQDEECDLFRLMRIRCEADDGFGAVMSQLEFEHNLDKVLAHHVIIDLKAAAAGSRLENPTRFLTNVSTFAEAQCRHLALENNAVLPLASRRLRTDDLEEMARNMALRRGIDY